MTKEQTVTGVPYYCPARGWITPDLPENVVSAKSEQILIPRKMLEQWAAAFDMIGLIYRAEEIKHILESV